MMSASFAILLLFSQAIDTQKSTLTIHVGKAGLFAAAAHEHWVAAPIASGSVDANSVRFAVEAAKLTVKPDDKVSEKDRAEIQSNMQNKVLESAAYPRIEFQSTGVRKMSDGVWKVTGDLTLHGATKPVAVEVTRQNGGYAGTAAIKQTDFGIQPIKIGGGVVKVKDQLEISFQIFTRE